MKILDDIIAALEVEILGYRNSFGAEPKVFQPAVINIVGQFALLIDPEASRALPLVATMDVDAFLEGDWPIKKAFRRILTAMGLEYDELSEEVWLPPGSVFLEYYRSPFLTVNYLDPLSTLTSKAVKAREKNRPLIRNALAHYGPELVTRIAQFNVDINFFSDESK